MKNLLNKSSIFQSYGTVISLLVLFVVSFSYLINGYFSIERAELVTFLASLLFLIIINQFSLNYKLLTILANIILGCLLISIAFSSKSTALLDVPLSLENLNPIWSLIWYFIFGAISLKLFNIKIDSTNMLLSATVWAGCAKLNWWVEGNMAAMLSDYFLPPRDWYIIAVLSLSVLAGYVWLFSDTILNKIPKKLRLTSIVTLSFLFVAIACLALYSKFATSPGEINNDRFYINWTFYLGPIKAFRDCCHLLFNNPSQYGFLNIIIPGLLPFSVTMAFRVSLFISVIVYLLTIIYLIVPLDKQKSVINLSAGFLVGVIILYANNLIAVFEPSVSGYRFAPSLLSLACLLVWLRSDGDKLKLAILGAALSVAILWSFESAIFALIPIIFILAANFLILLIERKSKSVKINTFFHVRSLLSIMVLIPLLSILAVSFYYRLFIGFWPDWYSYVEIPIIYSMLGFGSLPINRLGAVLFLGILFSFMICYVSLLFRKKEYSFFIISVALVSYQIAVTTYFIGRSHDNNILNLIPIFVSTSAFLVFNCTAIKINEATNYIKMFLLSTIVILIVIETTDEWDWKSKFHAPKTYFHEDTFPASTMEWLKLPADSYIIDITWGDALAGPAFPEFIDSTYKQWYPAVPWSVMEILSEERRNLYTDRVLSMLKMSRIGKHPVFVINAYPVVSARESIWMSFITTRLAYHGLKLGEGYIVKEKSRIVYPVQLVTDSHQ